MEFIPHRGSATKKLQEKENMIILLEMISASVSDIVANRHPANQKPVENVYSCSHCIKHLAYTLTLTITI